MATSSHCLKRILIVGDDPSVLQALRVSLSGAGFHVLTSSMVGSAIDTVISYLPDLVLLDIVQTDLRSVYLRELLWRSDSTRHIPVLLLIDKAEEDRFPPILGASFDYITKPVDPNKVVANVKSYLPDLPYDMDVNPLTGLPGERWINHELLMRVTQKKPFALMNLDINDLSPFRRAYGAARAERAVRLVARILGEAVRLFGNSNDFVGHIDENDFYIITSSDRALAICQRTISKFDDNIKDLYKQEDIVRGYIECEYSPGSLGKYPIMTVSIGVTRSENQHFGDPLAVRRAASEVREHAKGQQCSSFFFDQRGEGLTLEGTLGNGRRQNSASVSSRKPAQLQRDTVELTQLITSQLRAPVTIVQSMIDYLTQDAQAHLTVDQRRHLDILQKHTHHLSDIISQLVMFYRIHQNEFPNHLQVVDLATTLNEIAGFAREIAAGKSLLVEVHGAEDVGRVVVDEQKLSQALLYTFYALVEYSPPQPHIRIDVSQTESHVRVTLVVNELSLSRGDMARVFRSFYRPQKLTVPNQGSIGLGFYLAKQLANSAGGTMTVRRRERITISFDFPKVWQSADERAKVIQKEIVNSRALAKTEMDQIGALFADSEEISSRVRTIIGSLDLLIEQMVLQANRAVALADDVMSQLAEEREQSRAFDAGFSGFLEMMIDLVERRDPYFAGHSRRVAITALAIGRDLGLPEEELRSLYYAGLLHDVGMMGISDRISGKSCQLSEGEALILQEHTIIGARAISAVEVLAPLVEPILHHHERYNGSGYPLGLKGQAIPLVSRILAVVDAYDAMISSRPYRQPIPTTLAIKRIIGAVGTQFDPKVVAVFRKLYGGDGTRGTLN